MVTAAEEPGKGAFVVHLKGAIDENVRFPHNLPADRSIRFDCGDVWRINSVGVKQWIRYFEGLKARGFRFTFERCSPALVEQMNVVSNFIDAEAVESVLVPYSCQGCAQELTQLLDAGALQSKKLDRPAPRCPKCAKPAELDVSPETYFAFLR